MKKLTLNKIIISNLTKQEAGRIKGGGITDYCQTAVYEGCDPGNTWDNCSEVCTEYCDTSYCPTTGFNVNTCPPICFGPTANGCLSDHC